MVHTGSLPIELEQSCLRHYVSGKKSLSWSTQKVKEICNHSASSPATEDRRKISHGRSTGLPPLFRWSTTVLIWMQGYLSIYPTDWINFPMSSPPSRFIYYFQYRLFFFYWKFFVFKSSLGISGTGALSHYDLVLVIQIIQNNMCTQTRWLYSGCHICNSWFELKWRLPTSSHVLDG